MRGAAKNWVESTHVLLHINQLFARIQVVVRRVKSRNVRAFWSLKGRLCAPFRSDEVVPLRQRVPRGPARAACAANVRLA